METKNARDFMDWFAQNMETLKYYVKNYDEDLFTEAFLRAVSAIERRGTIVENPTAYFLTTYRATFLDTKKSPRWCDESLDQPMDGGEAAYFVSPLEAEASLVVAPDFNSALYEEVVSTLNTEILDYARQNFDPLSSALFEIYTALFPDTSYARLSVMLGISEPKIKQRVGPIRKAVAHKFEQRREYLLSLV